MAKDDVQINQLIDWFTADKFIFDAAKCVVLDL